MSILKKKPEIIYEDKAIVVVNKPPFLLTIPDRYAVEKPNILAYLKNTRDEVFTVHRIDKETSGILVFAKTEQAHKHLSKQFQERSIDKFYLTLVDGKMYQQEGVIDKAIAQNPSRQEKMIITEKGKPSLTHYKVVECFKHFSLVEANIKTGRTHQIRVHFESMGYPLAVDAIYGRRDAFFLSEIKGKKYRLGKDQDERPLISRSILHAQRILFDHPTSGERVEFKAELPKDFSAVVKQLRKWDKD